MSSILIGRRPEAFGSRFGEIKSTLVPWGAWGRGVGLEGGSGAGSMLVGWFEREGNETGWFSVCYCSISLQNMTGGKFHILRDPAARNA